MASGNQFRPTLSLAAVAPLLQKAFFDKHAPAVAIVINSPGGSAVQSRLIFQRIRSLAEEKNMKVLVFVEDVAASGGYMIAASGDEIFVDPSSIIGSIGVVSASFGFQDMIKKIGVERRVHTAGKNNVVAWKNHPDTNDRRSSRHHGSPRFPRGTRGARIARDAGIGRHPRAHRARPDRGGIRAGA